GGDVAGVTGARTAGEDEHDSAAGLLRGHDGRLGGLRVAVLDEFEVEARGVELDRFRGGEHLHAVIGPGHARGHRRVVEAGGAAGPGGQVSGEHAGDDRVVAVPVERGEVG